VAPSKFQNKKFLDPVGSLKKKRNPKNLKPTNQLLSQKSNTQLALEQGVCHTLALPFTLKGILRQKKSYENSNISPCKNIVFKKSSKRNQNHSRYYNSITNLKFQHKPKYHLSKTLI
jgi:hypothetical protein